MELAAQQDGHCTNGDIGQVEQRQQAQTDRAGETAGDSIRIHHGAHIRRGIHQSDHATCHHHRQQERRSEAERLHRPGGQLAAQQQRTPDTRAQTNNHGSTIDQRGRNQRLPHVRRGQIKDLGGIPQHEPRQKSHQQWDQQAQHDKDSEATHTHTLADYLGGSAGRGPYIDERRRQR